jgi:hypothetical protein
MTRLATLLTAAITLCLLSACTDYSAIASFKAEVSTLNEWIRAQQKAVDQNPLSGFALAAEASAKMKAIKTDKLPPDLQQAWKGLLEAYEKMEADVAGFPAKPEELPAYFAKRQADDPAFVEKFKSRIQVRNIEANASLIKLRQVAHHYGISNFDDFGTPN